MNYEESRERYGKLARSIASKYSEAATRLGVTETQLVEAALNGAEAGARKYKEGSSYKIEAYLTWWMRRSVHIAIVERALEVAKEDKGLARGVLLELLE